MQIKTVKIILKLFGLCFQYGVPLVQSAINALGKDQITCEDIDKLIITKEPEEF